MWELQSASELLSVYGIALLGIAVVAVIIYAIFAVPSSSVPNLCTFSGYVSCKNIAIGSNSAMSRAILLFSNSQQYTVENAIPTINIAGTGTFSGNCSPYLALPGGVFECVINFNKKMTPNQLSSGNLSLGITVCSALGQKNCASSLRENYSGKFNVHISPVVPPPRCTISLSGNTVTPIGIKNGLTANVKLFNTNIAGATVNFTTANSLDVALTESLINTDSNGNATTLAYSSIPGNYVITASFANCTVSNTITYQAPPVFLSVLSNGCGVASGSGGYPYGSNIGFSIAPYNGYALTGWSGSGSGSYTGNSLSGNVVLYNSVSESASCKLNPSQLYTLNVLENPSGAGYVSGSGYYAYGQDAQVNVSTPASAGIQQYVSNYFKPGSSIFTTPSGTSPSTVYNIYVVGGGGGGGYGYSGAGASTGGSGGGGGAYFAGSVSGYSAGTDFYVNVGSGASSSNGQGSASSVSGPGFSVYSLGGQGGSGNFDTGGCPIFPGGSGGTAGSSGSITAIANKPGGAGQPDTCTVGGSGGNSGNNEGAGGAGGGSASTHNSNSGYPGGNFGGGGGGGAAGEGSGNKYCHGTGCTQPGGAGAGGSVIITWTEPVLQSQYTFSQWTCSGEPSCHSGTQANFSLMITANTIETANFNPNLLPGSNTFTSPGTYSFVTPQGSTPFTLYTVTLIGAGGYGGQGFWGAHGWDAGAGGGGGAYMNFNLHGLNPGTILTINVGSSGHTTPNQGTSPLNPNIPWTYYADYGSGTNISTIGMFAGSAGGAGGGTQADSGSCFPLPGGPGGAFTYFGGQITNVSAFDGSSGQSIGCALYTGGAGGAGGSSGNDQGPGGLAGPHTEGGGNGGIWGGGGGGGGLPAYVDCHSIGCQTPGGLGASGYAAISWN